MKEIYAVTGAFGFLGNAIVDNCSLKKTVRVLDIGQDNTDY
jgi:nucleoside-diphosphate-sugar epimerase